MKDLETSGRAQVVMPVGDLQGRAVWTESGERIGTVRGVQQDDDGRIVALDVRERWMLGPHHEIPAAGMRMEDGDVIVPAGAAAATRRRRSERDHADRHDHVDDDVVARRRTGAFAPATAPVLLAGREGARGRFGGLDLLGSLVGALVTFASLVIVGGVLGAIFGTEVASFDTSLDTFEAVTTESLVIGAVTLFVACLIGGWAAGRSARFDGVANGLMSVAWVLLLGVALGALGAWLGDEYDVFANADLPEFSTDEFALWGSVAFAAALVLMLLGGALGGALGEAWHRRADRAMLDVVTVDEGAASASGQVGSSGASQHVDDRDVVVDDPTDRRPH